MSKTTSRRQFVGMMAGAGAVTWFAPNLSLAAGPEGRYLVLVILRGALDGLAAVVPYHESRLMSLRENLVPAAPGDENGALSLGVDGFALHPGLPFLHTSFHAGEMSVLHAAASPYRERSHFDGQDVLENGATTALGEDSGWLNRALQKTAGAHEAAAVAPTVPLVLRGDAHAVSWAPSVLPEPSDSTMDRLMNLYAEDEPLRTALGDAKALSMAAGEVEGDARAIVRGRSFPPVLEAAANLVASDAASVVALSLSGWDTHDNQGSDSGALAQRLGQLDAGLALLKQKLGAKWQHTTVMVVTEFGRTVAENGTRGSDHGTGGASFLLGGAVHGGKLLGDWPGLAQSALHEGRDLYPANDLRGLFKGVLRDHLGVSRSDLDGFVFPGSRPVAPLDGLIRA